MVIIDGGGRTLMPGLIDAHWHAFLVAPPTPVLLTADIGYLHLLAGQEAGNTLQRGFTSIRDLAGLPSASSVPSIPASSPAHASGPPA